MNKLDGMFHSQNFILLLIKRSSFHMQYIFVVAIYVVVYTIRDFVNYVTTAKINFNSNRNAEHIVRFDLPHLLVLVMLCRYGSFNMCKPFT